MTTDPEVPTPAQLAQLAGAIDTNSGAVAAFARSVRRWFVAAAVLAIVGIAFATFGAVQSSDARATADRAEKALAVFQQSVADSREGSCIQANKIGVSYNAFVGLVVEVLTPAPNVVVPAEVRVSLAKTAARFAALKIPKRDCTPAGIAAYLTPDKP